ncbi:MAG: glyoxalase [Gammaproteobacteria bacterium]|nr:VOC family protein [Gammaproteobacteria bacterium]GIK34731.1 MAG: glyoxalase [Gammaproteobacteria bacterium]
MSNAAQTAKPDTLAPISSIHHAAYRCRDAEQTRWFYEDVLGLPLVAAIINEKVAGLDKDIPYLHLFFGLADGNTIAFFDAPEGATAEQFQRMAGFDRHVAFLVNTEQELLDWQKRINAAGVNCHGPVDHGIVRSIYMYDPNGLQTEICLRAPGYDAAMAEQKKVARDNIRKWDMRTRATKEARFGAAALDRRSSQPSTRKK